MTGQYNRQGEPEGLVRLIWPNGDVYEGFYADGCYNGFGVLYQGDTLRVGWWTDHQRIGNYMDLDFPAMTVKESGWYENFERQGDRRDHAVYRPFKVEDVFAKAVPEDEAAGGQGPVKGKTPKERSEEAKKKKAEEAKEQERIR